MICQLAGSSTFHELPGPGRLSWKARSLSHTLLLSFILQGENTLFGCLVSELVEGSQGGLPDAAADLIKALLDPETMDTVGGHFESCFSLTDRICS